ncbi:MAG TPA: zf-HC2 domain-containing protein [Bryobacteraceae bacterium]|nr:zf-HC2 domain-containing protein [Bryobacteraceae bacterium]
MEHSKAIDSMAAERYILGELNMDERDAFEEHFFDCPECAMSVRDGAKIEATIRLGVPHGAALPRSRMNWWAAACVVLAGGLAYQPVVQQIAENRKPHIQTTHVLLPQPINGDVRGAEAKEVDASTGEPVRIDFPFISTIPGPYRGQIRDSRGRQVGDTFDVPPPSPDSDLTLFVTEGVLTSGTYTLVIRGAGGQEVSTYPFKVRLR